MKRKTFEEWKVLVNEKVIERTGGLSADDLPDCPYYDWYNERMSPSEAARRAIRMAWSM